MPKRKHESHTHTNRKESGFIANDLTRTMNKNEKIIMGILVGGIVIFLALSIIILFGKSKEITTENLPTTTLSPSKKVNLTPYPTIPPVHDTTVMVNTRRFNPSSTSIPKGGVIQFINIDQEPLTIEANDTNSTVLNIGTIQPGELKQVTFNTSGTYTYKLKEKPAMTGIIIIN